MFTARATTRMPTTSEIAFGEEIEIAQGVELARPSHLYAVANGTAEQVDSVHVGGVALLVAEGLFRITR